MNLRERLLAVQQMFAAVDSPEQLQNLMVEGGMLVAKMIDQKILPADDYYRDKVEQCRQSPVPRWDTSRADEHYMTLFFLIADKFSERPRTLYRVTEQTSPWVLRRQAGPMVETQIVDSFSVRLETKWNEDYRRQGQRYSLFVAELLPLTPLVKTTGDAEPSKKTSGGGKRIRRRKGEQKLTSQGLSLVAALCTWHEIEANGKSVLFNKQKPAIGCREVEREFKIPFATASEQFKGLFGSHRGYSQKWARNPEGFAYHLATLNGEVFCFGAEAHEEQFSESGIED